MCKAALVFGEEIVDTRSLSRILNVPVILHPECDWEPDPDGECLCNCDVPEMAKAAKMHCSNVTKDVRLPCINWILIPLPQAPRTGRCHVDSYMRLVRTCVSTEADVLRRYRVRKGMPAVRRRLAVQLRRLGRRGGG